MSLGQNELLGSMMPNYMGSANFRYNVEDYLEDGDQKSVSHSYELDIAED
jgi:hypothetical protein